VGGIIQESWAALSHYTRAASLESAFGARRKLESTRNLTTIKALGAQAILLKTAPSSLERRLGDG
jgi:hypothetical protein